MIRTFLTSCSLSLAAIAFGQVETIDPPVKANGRYWFIGVGTSFQSMYDEGISFVRYNGSGVTPVLGLVKMTDSKFRNFSLGAGFVPLRTDRSNELRPMEVKTTRIVADYQQLRRIKQWSKQLSLYVGGDVSLLFNLKMAEQLDNSQLVYDYTLAIGPAGKLDKIVRLKKRDCIVSFDLRVPLLSHIARPYYLNRIEFIDPKNDFIGDLLNNSSLTSVNKNLRIQTGLSLYYPLFNKNRLRLSYNWDFYKMRTINSVYHAEHLVSFVFMSNY